MAAAMARGWRGKFKEMLFTDAGSGRAAELAREVGGKAVDSNAELAERADLVVLAVKPAQLKKVAPELQAARIVISLLGATSLRDVAELFPGAEVARVMPNIAVEKEQGVLCVAGALADQTRRLLEALGDVVDLPDFEFDAATAVMACAPAYLALAAEAIINAGARTDLGEQQTKDLLVKTMAGTAEVLKDRSPIYVRKAVASRGGSTEAGLEELEQAEVRAAFEAAVQASLEKMMRG